MDIKKKKEQINQDTGKNIESNLTAPSSTEQMIDLFLWAN